MHIRKRYLLFVVLVLAAAGWFMSIKLIRKSEEREYNLTLQELKGVTKLVIWEQTFTLNDLETEQKVYFNWLTSKESVLSTVKGKMGFHIDLSDSANTSFELNKDSIIIKAPLKITFVSLDMGTLQQVREISIDPSIKVDKSEVVKHLDHKALEQYLPQIVAQIKNKRLIDQEKQLSKLTGKPVKIILTKMPGVNDWKGE
jgi:hypothetical protein